MPKDFSIPEAISQLARMIEEDSKETLSEKLMEKYRENPVLFCEEVLGVTIWDKQKEIMNSVKDNSRTTVRSCHSIGKSFIAACTVLWFLKSFRPSTVITTAPTDRQVKGVLWQEIASIYHNSKEPIGGRLLTQNLTMSNTEKWFAMGFTAREYSSDRFQGFHNENILIIADEASGISKNIFEGIEGLLSSGNAKLLLIGNPIDKASVFGDSFKSASPYNKIHISAFDTPNLKTGKVVLPYLVSKQWVEDKKKEWGEDSPLYQVRILGNFPDQAEDSLISLTWIENAINRDIEPNGDRVIGLDISRFGSDETIATVRDGGKTEGIIAWSKQDTMYAARRLGLMMKDLNIGVSNIDEGAMGAGSVDRLKEQGYNVKGINFGERANRSDTFINIRAEMYWHLRELFRNGQISIPDDTILADELSKIKYKFNSSGKIQIESKEEIKERIGRSPDRADSLALCFMDPVSSTETIGTVGSLFENNDARDPIIEGRLTGFDRKEVYTNCPRCGLKSCLIMENEIFRCFNCGTDYDKEGQPIRLKSSLADALNRIERWRR